MTNISSKDLEIISKFYSENTPPETLFSQSEIPKKEGHAE